MRNILLAALLAVFAARAPAQLPPLSTLSKSFFTALGPDAGSPLPLGKTKSAGGNGGKDFSETRSGGILVGLEIWKGDYAGDDTVKAIRPIYETEKGRVTGRIYGTKKGTSTKIEAKEGFAISGIEVRGTYVVNELRVLFWQIHETGPSLDAADAYKSDAVVESKSSKGFRQLSANGKIVVGIFGSSAFALDSLGLVYIDRN